MVAFNNKYDTIKLEAIIRLIRDHTIFLNVIHCKSSNYYYMINF
jgi:hypothetical protein